MQYSSGEAALQAMRVLRGSRLADGVSPRRRSISPLSRKRSPRRSPRRRTPPRRGSPSRRSPPRLRARDLPEYASCTLWIGQVITTSFKLSDNAQLMLYTCIDLAHSTHQLSYIKTKFLCTLHPPKTARYLVSWQIGSELSPSQILHPPCRQICDVHCRSGQMSMSGN